MRRDMRSSPFALIIPIVLMVATADAQDSAPRVDWLESCSVAQAGDGTREAWCGSYSVYENREAQSGRQIDLNVLVVPAWAVERQPDPVFFFHGGPGGAATEAASGVLWMLQHLEGSRDVVFVDQRGTGKSNPLDCDERDAGESLQRYFNEFLEIDFVKRCLERLSASADVRLYTTPIAMDDINEVRAALGYEQINLYGGSYGTRAAMVYLRRHPATVRSAVLKGVAPVDMKNPLPFSEAAERGLRATFDACATEPACDAVFPNLESDWKRTMAQFDKGWVPATVTHPKTDRVEEVKIAKGVFADGIRHFLYSVQGARHVPRVIHAAARGDFSIYAQRELNQTIGFDNLLSMGMFITVTCSEDVRFIEEADIAPATSGTFLGDYRVRRQQEACRHWPLGDVDESYMEPLNVETPVLLLSGMYDTATRYEHGIEVAKHLPNSLHTIVPNESHSYANPECELPIVARFVQQGTVEGLDTSCVLETKRPAFVVDLVP